MGFLSSLCSCFEKRQKRRGGDEADDNGEESFNLFYELRALQIATNFFSDLNQLGHGGFGPVYKVRTAYLILIFPLQVTISKNSTRNLPRLALLLGN